MEPTKISFWRFVMTMREKIEGALFAVILVVGLPALIFVTQGTPT
jgi:hypothetical protein